VNKTVLVLLIVQTLFTAIGAVAGVIAVRDRVRFDWAPRVFLVALIVVIIATGVLDFYTRFNQYEGADARVTAQTVPAPRWPTFSKQEISDWAEALRPFPTPVTMEIQYSSEQDQEFVAGIVEVEKEAKWSSAGAGLGGVMSGIYLSAGKDHEDLARELKALIDKKTDTRVELSIVPNSRADMHLYVGRKPPT
jgi:hypothetical protein